jgi:hypothetical protein
MDMEDHCHLQAHREAEAARGALQLSVQAVDGEAPQRLELQSPKAVAPVLRLDQVLHVIATVYDPDTVGITAMTLAVEQWLPLGDEVVGAVDELFQTADLDEHRRSKLLAGAAAGLWRGGRRQAAVDLVHSCEPGERHSAALWVQLGLFDVENSDPAAAARAFGAALEVEPDRKDAAFFLQKVTTGASPAAESEKLQAKSRKESARKIGPF